MAVCSEPSPSRSSPWLIEAAKKSSQDLPEGGIQKSTKKHLSHILITEAAVKAIERKANSSKYNRSWPKAVLDALDDAILQNRWESAIKIFGLLRKQLWYKPRSQTYTKLLVMLGKCRQPKEAGLIFEIMLSEGLKPTIDAYTALVSAYGFGGLLDRALETVEEMKSTSDCKPDTVTYSILINCCTKLHEFDMIGRILDDMSNMGIHCNAVTYNTMIDGYGKAELFEMMESTLSDMIEDDTCLPDIFTMNSIVGAYGNCGLIVKMEKWFEEFQLMGVYPTVMTFNILVKSYGKASAYDKMGFVVDYMRKRFVSPTVVTFNIVIEAFGRAGKIEKMEEFFLEMKHQGMKPNAITYCSLVSAYSKAGLVGKVDSTMRQVENSDVLLDTPFFNSIISAYGLAGDVESMGEMFYVMKERNCEPDYVTFATMIRAYRNVGMLDTAESFESTMIARTQHSGVRSCLLSRASQKQSSFSRMAHR